MPISQAGKEYYLIRVAGVTDWCFGVDVNDSNSFKISNSIAPGLSRDFLKITTAGALISTASIDFADGTVLLPSISFTSDPSTGLSYGGSNSLKISTNGTLALTLSSAQLATFAGVIQTNATSNQLVINPGAHKFTITAASPAADRVITIPDPGASANVVLDQGAYTIAGALTLSSALILNNAFTVNGDGTNAGFSVSAANLITLGSGGGGRLVQRSDSGLGLIEQSNASQALLSGTTQVGFVAAIRGNSSATARVVAFTAEPRTDAVSFTTGILAGVRILTPTIGAGSAATRNIGLLFQGVGAGGTSNIFISDNETAVGNYFINSSSASPSVLSGALTLAPTTNQLVLGVTNTVTISSTAPASSRTYTIPDAGGAANFVMSAGNQTISGVQTFSGQLIGKGTATNDSATAGNIGEQIIANLATGSAVSLSTGAAANVISISLTAGDWDVSGCIVFKPGATTSITILGAAISGTTGAVPAVIGQNSGNDFLVQDSTAAFVPGANDDSVVIPPIRVSLSGTTTTFLVAKATFSISTLNAYGQIRARRVR